MAPTDYSENCTWIVTRGVGRRQTHDLCGKPATHVTFALNGFCKRHAATKEGRRAQRAGGLVAKAAAA